MADTMYRMTMAYKYGGDIFEYFYDSGKTEIEFDLILEAEAISFIPVLLNRTLRMPLNIYCTEESSYVVKTTVSGKENVIVHPFSELKYQSSSRVLISYCRWNYALF